MNNIKAIIFDYDGVIVDSFPSIFEIYKEICNEFKLDFPQDIEEFRKVYGYRYQECFQNLKIKGKNIDRANEIFKTEIVKKEHKVFNNIEEVLIELNKKYKLFLVSASYKAEVLKKLGDNKLIKYFDKIYCGSDTNTSKENLINNLLKEKKLLKREIISIGDRTIDFDIAKKVGLNDDNIIIVSYGWGYDKDKVKIKNIAHSPKDIIKILNS